MQWLKRVCRLMLKTQLSIEIYPLLELITPSLDIKLTAKFVFVIELGLSQLSNKTQFT